jgi:hypothetical protein
MKFYKWFESRIRSVSGDVVATAVTMAVTMLVVEAVAEAASVAAPKVSASQPHPNPQQYYIWIIPFWNSPPTPNNMSYSTVGFS